MHPGLSPRDRFLSIFWGFLFFDVAGRRKREEGRRKKKKRLPITNYQLSTVPGQLREGGFIRLLIWGTDGW
jgi:hypothetical protein